jgi:hypothetical protein
MELASVLAGEPFSDRPGCTQPVLAEVARQVNDTVNDSVRQRLARLVPDVIGVGRNGPVTSAAVVVAVTEPALLVDAANQRLRRAHRRAVRRRDARGVGSLWVRISDRAYRRRARHVIARCVQTVDRRGCDALVELLGEAVAAASEADLPAGEPSACCGGATRGRPG